MKPGDLVERYRLVRLLGRGGMGTVWLAEHTTLGGQHALKFLDPYLLGQEHVRERFLDEGRIQSRLVHPSIARVTDLLTDGAAGLVMDYVPGPTLGDWLEANGPASASQARPILAALLGAVGLAHEQGIIHRDLKPSNILMRGGKLDPVVVDFGIAKVQRDQGRGRTRTGITMGTAGYMPPEQARDSSRADARSDLYALGVILHEVLSGRPRFVGDSDLDVTIAVVHGDAQPLPTSVDRGLAACVSKAASMMPEDRFASANEFALALEPAVSLEARCQRLEKENRALKANLARLQVKPKRKEPPPPPKWRESKAPPSGDNYCPSCFVVYPPRVRCCGACGVNLW